MARTKITTYVTPEIAELIKREASRKVRSESEIVENALIQTLLPTDHGADQAAIMAGLGQLSRRITAVEQIVEMHFELSTQSSYWLLGMTPDDGNEAEETNRQALGNSRLKSILSDVRNKVSNGRSTLQAILNATASKAPSPPAPPKG